MDANAGRFIEEQTAEAWMQRIEVGEVVKIKGEELRVVSIEDRRITLELMSAEDRVLGEESAMASLFALRESMKR